MIKVVMFDLDGTLLPMDQDNFVKAYFGGLAKKMQPFGYDMNDVVEAVRYGVASMIKNDGTTLYLTRDYAAVVDRFKDYNFDKLLYVTDVAQKLHFQQLLQ